MTKSFAQKGHPKAQPTSQRLPLPSTPSATPTGGKKQPYNTIWQNAPLERLGELLMLKGTNPAASVSLVGNSVRAKRVAGEEGRSHA